MLCVNLEPSLNHKISYIMNRKERNQWIKYSDIKKCSSLQEAYEWRFSTNRKPYQTDYYYNEFYAEMIENGKIQSLNAIQAIKRLNDEIVDPEKGLQVLKVLFDFYKGNLPGGIFGIYKFYLTDSKEQKAIKHLAEKEEDLAIWWKLTEGDGHYDFDSEENRLYLYYYTPPNNPASSW